MIFRNRKEPKVQATEEQKKEDRERDREFNDALARKRALDNQLRLIELRRENWKPS